MGHQVSILTGNLSGETPDERVYSIKQVLASRSMARRVFDGLWYRAAPGTAHRRVSRRLLLTMVQRAIAERGIQIIEVEESFGMARWIREATATPICVRLHGPWFLNGPALGVPDNSEFRQRVREEGRAIRLAEAVSAPSQNVLDQVREFYGLPLPEAEVIPYPTPLVEAAQRWQPEGCDPRRVLFIGRFDRHKGGDLIIEAFSIVLQEFPDARLGFVGPDRGCTTDDGWIWSLSDFVRARIPGALETGTVELLGQLPNSALAPLRRGAAVTVVCSRYDNFPNTALEAIAMGCPIAAADVGGIPEIVRDGVTGLLHQAGDPHDLAAKIIELLKDPTRAARLGHQAAAECEQRFHPNVIAPQLVDLYRRVVGRPKRLPQICHS